MSEEFPNTVLPEGEVPAENPNQAPEEYAVFTDFFNEDDDPADFDPTQVISLRSSSGGSFDVPSSEPMAISAVLQAANLAVGQGIEFWVNGTRVESDFVVAPGATINAIGMVKGG